MHCTEVLEERDCVVYQSIDVCNGCFRARFVKSAPSPQHLHTDIVKQRSRDCAHAECFFIKKLRMELVIRDIDSQIQVMRLLVRISSGHAIFHELDTINDQYNESKCRNRLFAVIFEQN